MFASGRSAGLSEWHLRRLRGHPVGLNPPDSGGSGGGLVPGVDGVVVSTDNGLTEDTTTEDGA